jgi:clan AA aspartic protease
MMTGIVNVDLEAVLRFSVGDAAGHSHDVEAVIDTGFNGFPTLPPALVAALALPWLCRQQGQLADGSFQAFDVYVAKVDWDGQPRNVEVEAAYAQPLIGMALMRGSELRVHVMPGGTMTIAGQPSTQSPHQP